MPRQLLTGQRENPSVHVASEALRKEIHPSREERAAFFANDLAAIMEEKQGFKFAVREAWLGSGLRHVFPRRPEASVAAACRERPVPAIDWRIAAIIDASQLIALRASERIFRDLADGITSILAGSKEDAEEESCNEFHDSPPWLIRRFMGMLPIWGN